MANGNKRFTYDPKQSGDLIRSQDWNKAMQEIMDLGEDVTRLVSLGEDVTRQINEKVNKAGDAMSGPLTIEGALSISGLVKAAKFEGDGSALTGIAASKWADAAGGIAYGGGNVGIGATTPEAKLQIIHTSQDANGNALILGPTNASNLRLGYHDNYSWLQSHGSKPLAINPIGNNVGIGTTTPRGFQVVLAEASRGGVAPSPGISMAGGAQGNASIELRNAGAGTPYIDFAQKVDTDYDARIRLTEPGKLAIEGANLGIGVTNPTETLEVNGTVKAAKFVGDGSGLTGIQGGRGGGGKWADRDGGIAYDGGNVDIGKNPIRFSSGWTGFPDAVTNQAEISNDTQTYKTLMIVGNKASGAERRVSVWDRLEVNGRMAVSQGIIQRGGDPITTTADLGLYSRVKGHWIRIVANAAPIKFFTDEAKDGIGANPVVTISAGGDLTVTGNIGVGTEKLEAKLTIADVKPGQRGLEVLGSAGNSHIPWTDGSIYLTGNISPEAKMTGDFIFRSYDGQNHANRFVINGKSGDVSITGIMQTNQLQIKTQSFKVEGNINQFYPIVFADNAWGDGALVLEICRSSVHIDSEWRGALVSKFTCHSSAWGHDANFETAEIHQSRQIFVSSYKNIFRSAKFVVWLRGGGTTYYWRANHPAALLDYEAKAKSYDAEDLPVKTAPDADLNALHVSKKSW